MPRRSNFPAHTHFNFLQILFLLSAILRVGTEEVGGTRARVKVHANDKIMFQRTYASPIVLEDYKLIFFPIQKVGCTVWKQLFRRMSGFQDWRTGRTWGRGTGLVYLADYDVKKASALMNDKSFIRALFVRDPKEKFLSAYLDKAVRTEYFYGKCLKACRRKASDKSICLKKSKDFTFFVKATRARGCYDSHWSPQSANIEEKYLNTLDFVGHLETSAQDARILLQKLGLWGMYGESGWGKYGNESIFESLSFVKHKTATSLETDIDRLKRYYTPETEKEIEDRFSEDYRREVFGLELRRIYQ